MPTHTVTVDGKLTKAFTKAMQNGIVYSPGSGALGRTTNARSRALGQKLRDEWLFQYPLLPAAVMTYAHIAVSREWTVVGTPRRAAKAVETLNNAAYVDSGGEAHFGWQAFAFRRVVDYLTLGRNAFLKPKGSRSVLQYVDPVEVLISGSTKMQVGKDRIINDLRSTKNQKYWNYLNTDWTRSELVMNYAAAAGPYAAIPLLSVLPSARMAYLIREHDSAKADGRKIRDIFVVADEAMQDALAQAMAANIALYNGASVTDHGIPIISVGVNNLFDGNSADVSKLFARMGLTEVDDNFDRSAFFLDYAQEIAAVLDMPLRTFWNDPRGSNRSLERVTQERSRRQGPAYYILGEERLINNSGILGKRVRFQFVEEIDTSLIKDRAEIAKTYAEAIDLLHSAIPQLSGDSVMAWLQQLGVLPRDEDLIKEISTISESPVQPEDMVDGDIEELLAAQSEEALQNEIEITKLQAEALNPPTGNTQIANDPNQDETKAIADFMRSQRPATIPDYGEVMLDSHGDIVDYRKRTYHIDYLMKTIVETASDFVGGIDAKVFDDEAAQILADAFNENEED